VLIAQAPNPDQGKRFIDFLLRPEIQKLLSGNEGMHSLDNIKPMQIDYEKLGSQSQVLSRGFLTQWADRPQ
jgi:ABC-type Fe3+ transport system substrate-binding protein